MNLKNLTIDVKDGVLTVVFTRHKALNALNNETLKELEQVIDYINTEESIKGVIITGGDGKAFVAGADIVQMQPYKSEEGRDYAGFAQNVFNKLEAIEKPIIAAVNGYALGGGCELALACDIRIASDNAVFAQPEVNLGVIPCFGGTQRLTRIIGQGKAKELIYTGNFINAIEAKEIGLVNKVVSTEDLMNEAEKMIRLITSKAPIAIKYAKLAISRGLDLDLFNGLELERDVAALCFATKDKDEGMNAFLEKRKPIFQNK